MTLDQLLAAHRFVERTAISEPSRCYCGWVGTRNRPCALGRDIWSEWVAHVAGEIRTTFGVVELLKPELAGKFDGGYFTTDVQGGRVWIQDRETGVEMPMQSADAEQFAAALLAAAKAAGKGTS